MLSFDSDVSFMKVAIVILGNRWVCPYVNTYTRILEKLGCEYDVILWDRDGSDRDGAHAFSSAGTQLGNPLVKTVYYFRYACFIKRRIEANGYDKVIVSGPHLAILLSLFLSKKYNGRYMLDYRDLSVEQHPLLSPFYSLALSGSACNVISSPGFRCFLPLSYNYYVSHNFSIDEARRSLETPSLCTLQRDGICDVLTVGSVRNFNSNVKVLSALANDKRFCMRFVGRGEAQTALQEYAKANDIENVEFSGFYEKEDEAAIVSGATFINIFFPMNNEHSVIMSNRFYLALIHKKPVIVTAGSTQASYVEEYGLGVVVKECGNLDSQLMEFLSKLDYKTFCNSCNSLLSRFVGEHEEFENAVVKFLQK